MSKFFSIDTRDAVKSLIVAFISAAGTALYKAIELGSFPQGWAQWKQILLVGTGAALAYLIKNLLTNSNDEFAKPEPK